MEQPLSPRSIASRGRSKISYQCRDPKMRRQLVSPQFDSFPPSLKSPSDTSTHPPSLSALLSPRTQKTTVRFSLPPEPHQPHTWTASSQAEAADSQSIAASNNATTPNNQFLMLTEHRNPLPDQAAMPANEPGTSINHPTIPRNLSPPVPTRTHPPLPRTPPTLLTLPAELKNQIYRAVLVEPVSIRAAHIMECLSRPPGHRLYCNPSRREDMRRVRALLQVNKQTTREASAVYYGENAFCLSALEPAQILRWLSLIGEANRRRLRRVRVDFDTRYCAELQEAGIKAFMDRVFRDWDGGVSSFREPAVEMVLGVQKRVEGVVRGFLRSLSVEMGGVVELTVVVPRDESRMGLPWEARTRKAVEEDGRLEVRPWVRKEWFWEGLGKLKGVRKLRVGVVESLEGAEEVRRRVEEAGIGVEELEIVAERRGFFEELDFGPRFWTGLGVKADGQILSMKLPSTTPIVGAYEK